MAHYFLDTEIFFVGTLTPFMYTWEEEFQFFHGDQEEYNFYRYRMKKAHVTICLPLISEILVMSGYKM